MQPFSVSQPLTPLEKSAECASSIIVCNLADTPIMLKIRSSTKLIQVSPVIFTMLPNARQRVQILSKSADEGELQFSGIFVDQSEPICQETEVSLLQDFFRRFEETAIQTKQYVEQILTLQFEQLAVQPKEGDFGRKVELLQQEISKLQNDIITLQNEVSSRERRLQMSESQLEVLAKQKEQLQAEVREKGLFKRVFGTEYRHFWSVLLIAVGFFVGGKAGK